MDEKKVAYTPTLGWGEEVYPLLSWCKLEKLRTARVMVVGCGALGNEVVKNMALFGVGHLVLVDFDHIETSNLTRSILFSIDDAQQHRSKSEVLAEKVRQINPEVEVQVIVGDVTHDVGLGLVRDMDVVVSCVDNRWARYCINRMCMRVQVPWVDGGIDGLEGTVRVFRSGENCYACNLGPEALKDMSRRLSCASVIRRNEEARRVATTPVIASIIGAVEVQEAVKLIHREELENGELTSLCGKMFYYEGQHLTTRLVDFRGYDDDCPVHEVWQPILKSELHTNDTLADTLDYLTKWLQAEQVEIQLCDHCFVDHVVHRLTDERWETQCPDFRLPEWIEQHEVLRYVPSHLLYLHEIRNMNEEFPHPQLTLKEIGIPARDVLVVETEKGTVFVEVND